MPTPTPPPQGTVVSRVWVQRVTNLASLATLAVIAIAFIQIILVLLGRGPVLDTMITDLVRPMQIAEALIFAASAMAIRLLLIHRSRRSPRARRMGLWLAGTAAVAAAIYLLAYGLRVSADLPLLLRPFIGDDPGPYAGLPASTTAFALLLLNGGTILLAYRGRPALIGQLLAIFGFVLGGRMLVEFMYGGRDLTSFPFNAGEVAVTGAICLLAVGGAALLARWDVGVMAALVGTGPGGLVLRTSLPAIILLPLLLLGFVAGQQIVDRPRVFGQVAVVVSLVIMFGVMALALTLDRRDRDRRVATEGESRARTALGQKAPVVSVLEKRLATIDDVDDLEGIEFSARCRSGEGVVAGDAHAIIRLGSRRIGLVLIDVAGHGAEPAITALRLKDALVQSLRAGWGPTRALDDTTWLLAESGQMATGVVADLDVESGRLRSVVAGHPPPLLLHEGRATPLEATGPLLYASVSADWQEHDVVMATDDTLFLYTDGLAETETAAGIATDLDSVLTVAERLHLAPNLDEMVDWLLDPGRGRAFRDDVTVMLVRRKAPPVPTSVDVPMVDHRAPAADARARYFLETR